MSARRKPTSTRDWVPVRNLFAESLDRQELYEAVKAVVLGHIDPLWQLSERTKTGLSRAIARSIMNMEKPSRTFPNPSEKV